MSVSMRTELPHRFVAALPLASRAPSQSRLPDQRLRYSFDMNRAEQPAILVPIPDVQSGRDERRIAIDHVGIKGLRYPLPFMDRDQVAHTTIATCNVYVALPDDRKGTHMSRLVALLEERAAPGAVPLTVATLRR